MSIGRTPVFFASTPQSSPPGSPKLPRLRRNERKISADQTLLSHLRTSIEQRNFPDAMDVIKLMEKHEHQYEKLENMEKLEKRLSFVNKVAEDSLIQVNSLSQENGLIVEDVKKLKEENKIYQKEIKKIISEKSGE
jgi:inosine/xanthosine triphosphate pyrophosphatase family protein